ncbi:hypothetical protein BGW80DRAFT_1406245 [Lactifluus volemus]|nr:hypothetical protein BGW80DRAFT_1428452 [Lactifluus volemus]KAH9953904.1 hypothetical protein BGW80DRAFT_1406245 [Lactifluus volemus]
MSRHHSTPPLDPPSQSRENSPSKDPDIGLQPCYSCGGAGYFNRYCIPSSSQSEAGNATPVPLTKKLKRDQERDFESSDDHASKRKRVTVDEVDLDTLTREITKQCVAGLKEYFEKDANLGTLKREITKECVAEIMRHLEQEGVEITARLRTNTRMS